MLLAVKQDVKVSKVESLVDHLLDLFLGLRGQLASINPLALKRVIVDLRAAFICIIIGGVGITLRSDVVLH